MGQVVDLERRQVEALARQLVPVLGLLIAIDRQRSDADAVVADHDNRPVGEIGRDLVEFGE
ncbi:MAG: hypothetical protein ACR2HM_11280 [Acidimicrobiales bacterium]